MGNLGEEGRGSKGKEPGAALQISREELGTQKRGSSSEKRVGAPTELSRTHTAPKATLNSCLPCLLPNPTSLSTREHRDLA